MGGAGSHPNICSAEKLFTAFCLIVPLHKYLDKVAVVLEGTQLHHLLPSPGTSCAASGNWFNATSVDAFLLLLLLLLLTAAAAAVAAAATLSLGLP